MSTAPAPATSSALVAAPTAVPVAVTSPAPSPAPSPVFTDADVTQLAERVESASLPHEAWTHAAHVAFAVALVRREGPRALDAIRSAILRSNAVNGIPQTPDGGYHETLTRFYVWAVERELARVAPDASLGVAATQVVASLFDRGIPLRHYTKARLMSWEARTGWVAPDLAPMDRLRA